MTPTPLKTYIVSSQHPSGNLHLVVHPGGGVSMELQDMNWCRATLFNDRRDALAAMDDLPHKTAKTCRILTLQVLGDVADDDSNSSHSS